MERNHLQKLLGRLSLDIGSRVEIGVLVGALDKPAIIPLLLVLALMTFIPLACTPAGLLSLFLYWRLLRGKCNLPSGMSHWPLPLDRITRLANKLKWIDRIFGRLIVPLWTPLCQQTSLLKSHCIYGLVCAVGTLIPIPGLNYLFAPALLLLSLGLYFSNGVVVLLAYGILPLQQIALTKLLVTFIGWIGAKFSAG